MRYLTGPELYEALEPHFDSALIIETFKVHGIPIKVHWVNESSLDEECRDHITNLLHWDPETTLVYYTPRQILQDGTDEYSNDRIRRLMWAKSSQEKVLCLFIENKTIEEMIELFRKTMKMKAFL